MSTPTPLLMTKLYVPPARAKLISRPRLIERLADGLTRPLTLISAPAGFGKTTLISEWRTSRQDMPIHLPGSRSKSKTTIPRASSLTS